MSGAQAEPKALREEIVRRGYYGKVRQNSRPPKKKGEWRTGVKPTAQAELPPPSLSSEGLLANNLSIIGKLEN